MIWAHWSLRELQSEIHRLAPDLLDRLEALLPAVAATLEAAGRPLGDLYARATLVRALTSFAPAECFTSPAYRRYCLDRLPPQQLVALGRELGVKGGSFLELRDAVVEQGWRSEDDRRRFLDFFRLPDRFMPRPPVPELSVEDIGGAGAATSQRPLRDYQVSVLEKAEHALQPPRSRLLMQMPTGSGKTRTAMEVVNAFLRRDRSPVVFWLAHSEELCQQALATFSGQWRDIGDRTVRACRLWGTHSAPVSVEKPMVVVASFQKLHAMLGSDKLLALDALRGRTTLVVVDEAHRSVAPTYKKVIEYLAHGQARVVGLSATPGRSVERETEKLVGLFFSTIVEIEAPPGISVVTHLRRQGVLSTLDVEPIVSRATFSLTPKERKHLETNFEFPAEFLERVGRNDIRNAEIITRLISEFGAGRQIVCFACSVDHSRFVASALNFLGVDAAHVDGTTAEETRRNIITRFRSGRLKVLCNFGVLSTGFDAPNTDAVMIARPTQSAVLYSQMVGRGMRGPAMGGSEICRLVDVRDNIQGIGSIDRLYTEFADMWH